VESSMDRENESNGAPRKVMDSKEERL